MYSMGVLEYYISLSIGGVLMFESEIDVNNLYLWVKCKENGQMNYAFIGILFTKGSNR